MLALGIVGRDEWQQGVFGGAGVPSLACRECCCCHRSCWPFPTNLGAQSTTQTTTEGVVLSFLLECGLASL